MSKTTSPNVAFAALLVGAVGIAFAPILAKVAVEADGLRAGARLSPVAAAFWRMAFAVPFFWAAALVKSRRDGVRASGARAPGRALLLPGLFFAADLGVWHWSFEFTSVANATLEANFASIIVPLVSLVWLGERFSWVFAAGAVAALAGMAQLVGASFAATGDAWIGDLMGLGVAFAYAGYLLSSKVLLGRYPVLFMLACATTACAGFLLVGVLVTPGRLFPQTAAGWGYLLALAATAQLFGQGLIAFGMSRLPAGFSAVTLVLQTVVAAFLGWMILGQAMTPAQMAAGGVVIAGIVVARIGAIVK